MESGCWISPVASFFKIGMTEHHTLELSFCLLFSGLPVEDTSPSRTIIDTGSPPIEYGRE